MTTTELPKLPVPHSELASYIAKTTDTPVETLVGPYRNYEAALRKLYAQDRHNAALDDPLMNVLPLFTKDTANIKTRARDLAAESTEEKERYIMALPEGKRREDGSPATVKDLKEFRHNFNVFCESSLVDLCWDNVVAAGSSAVNCLLPVPQEYKKSKRTLRKYYHEKFAPASDIDLFLYGLDEEEAIEKIKQIEASVRDAILSEVTVVRTKNALTICSQYPTRHIQVVLRVYKNISEILTGFDIDCSGAAYDGKQVYCTPRALASYITQINPIDLSRRSPSYENRLSKYSHRNFEVYWPELDRSRVDPTIFERSFRRTLGLARLLILERLPTTNARDEYLKKRREERGRPELEHRFNYRLFGNIKDAYEDEVAEWVDEEEVSNYHTFTVPYGIKFNAKKIEKLCYTRDLLLNAEWNQPKEREVYLHRHPAFFGRVQDVVQDCCGTCPKPTTVEEVEIADKEGEIYVSGKVAFRIDDPGRQQIGSFNPLTEDDWTEMAYVGNTARLCQAIVDEDLEHVEDWLSQDGADPNRRDYTGRTPLHLAVTSSSPAIVQALVDHGARLIARLVDGRTALHLAAARGNVEIVKILLTKSAFNEVEEEEKRDQRRRAREAELKDVIDGADSKSEQIESDNDDTDDENTDDEDEESDGELIDDDESDKNAHSVATGSFVKVDKNEDAKAEETMTLEDDESDPDFYNIDVVAWDSHCSALHYAIVGGHVEVVKLLAEEFAADVLNPVKFGENSEYEPRAALLTLVLALTLPLKQATAMAETLLALGASSSQADVDGITAFHRYVQHGDSDLVSTLWDNDKLGLKTAINHLAVTGSWWYSNATSPLMTAIDKGDPTMILRLLEAGAKPQIDFEDWLKGAKFSFESSLGDFETNQKKFRSNIEQPLIIAIRSTEPAMALELLDRGADPNVITKASYGLVENTWSYNYNKGYSALDEVRRCLKVLRKFKEETIHFYFSNAALQGGHNHQHYKAPNGPQQTDEFLQKFKAGTYQHWVVKRDIENRLASYKEEVKRFHEQRKEQLNDEHVKIKKEAIAEMLSQLQKVEEALVARGALTFKEQYPDIEEPAKHNKQATDEKTPVYNYTFSFQGTSDMTESRKAACIELFEAAWTDDLERIKSLTLSAWGTDQSEAPLKMAVKDHNWNTPFSLAFLRGHLDTARAILEIIQAQWSPVEEQAKRYKMTRDEDDGDSYESDEDDDDEHPKIYEEIVDDQFTIENIGQVSMKVKSHELPCRILEQSAPTFVVRDGQIENSTDTQFLLHFAIKNNDKERFNFLVDTNVHFRTHLPSEAEEDESDRFYSLPGYAFSLAIKLGRTDFLSNVITRFGAGIPLEHLVKKSGVEIKTKPKSYQGLTVYGKKRSDWANAGRNVIVKQATGIQVPPLLTAAQEGCLTSVEWFLSDTPMRQYLEFGKSKVAKEDPRLKHLNKSSGGFDRAVGKWLGLQNDIVIHCAVLGPLGDETNRLIQYLIRVCPSSLEAKSDGGFTPLHLACLMGRGQFAKTLIDAGADQSVKDKNYRNIVHALMVNKPKLNLLEKLLNLLDPGLRSHLFLQRTNLTDGGDTPLHFWLKGANGVTYEPHQRDVNQFQPEESDYNVEILKLILKYSGGDDLGILDGSGDTVLHSSVFRLLPKHIQVIIDHSPSLLYRENAVGRTPAEIAYDQFVGMEVKPPPHVTIQGDPYSGHANYTNRQPRVYARLSKPAEPMRKEQVWNVVQKYQAKHPGKRRLVSLNEANDVARRLGEEHAWDRYRPMHTTQNQENEDHENEEEAQKVEEKESDFVAATYTMQTGQAWKVEESKED